VSATRCGVPHRSRDPLSRIKSFAISDDRILRENTHNSAKDPGEMALFGKPVTKAICAASVSRPGEVLGLSFAGHLPASGDSPVDALNASHETGIEMSVRQLDSINRTMSTREHP